MSVYNSFSYIYPTRPKNAVPVDYLKNWDNNTMLGQPKVNGSNCLIFTNGTTYRTMNRHNQNLTNFQLDRSEISKLYEKTTPGTWMVINGEYLNKSKRDENNVVFNHKLIIFDILVINSDYLIGKTFKGRVEILDNLYGKNDSDKDYFYSITENIYRVKTYENNFVELFDSLSKIDMIEGLVLKRKNAGLERGNTENNNSKSQVKFRKPTKNYQY